MTHAHLTSLVLSLLLLIFIVIRQKQGKTIKVWHMVLRSSYLLIIATGFMLFMSAYSIPMSYYLKAIMGIVMIGLFEMVIVRKQKGKATDVLWITFSIVLVILLAMGFTLPQGIDLLK
ncbi:DUF1516 family protein [Neobacillus jeddahensis]|uniref:DUF1516 family protein n=1 Tax=Neobacillus jeddahensis TaxID=1461580 RepID=UPI00058D7F76|nr:DUF1516 family protein [Neobacillus jeddahensis]